MKKFIGFSLFSLIGTLVIASIATIVNNNHHNVLPVAGSFETYSLVFNKDINKLSDSDGASTVYTTLGNEISMRHSDAEQLDTSWRNLMANDYVENVSMLAGMQSIEITGSLSGNAFIYYSGDDEVSSYRQSEMVFGLDGVYRYYFENRVPNYFKIVTDNASTLRIDTMTIVYSCFDSYVDIYPNCSVDAGHIDGEGRYLVGDVATLLAIPNDGYQFLYWLKEGNILSYNTTLSYVVGATNDIDAVFSLIAAPTSMNLGQGDIAYSSGTWTSLSDFSVGMFENRGFTIGTYSATVRKSVVGEDTGLVFRYSGDNNPYWERIGVSYYFFFINQDGAPYLASSINGVWKVLGIAQKVFNVDMDYRLSVSISNQNEISCFVDDELLIQLTDPNILVGSGFGLRFQKMNSYAFNINVESSVKESSKNTASWKYANGQFNEVDGTLTSTDSFMLAYANDLIIEEGKVYETVYRAGVGQDAGMVMTRSDFNYAGWEFLKQYHTCLITAGGGMFVSSIGDNAGNYGNWVAYDTNNSIKFYSPTNTYKLGMQVINGLVKFFVDGMFFGETIDQFGLVGGIVGVRSALAGASFEKITVRDNPGGIDWYQRSGAMSYDASTGVLTGNVDGCLAWANNASFGPGKKVTYTQQSNNYNFGAFGFGCGDKVNTKWQQLPYYYLNIENRRLILSGPGTAGELYNAFCEHLSESSQTGNTVSVAWTLNDDVNVFDITVNNVHITTITDSVNNFKGSEFGFLSVGDPISWHSISLTTIE